MSRDKRLSRTQEVDGSSPFSSTKIKSLNPLTLIFGSTSSMRAMCASTISTALNLRDRFRAARTTETSSPSAS